MSFESDPSFLKTIKHMLADPAKTIHMHGKCPHCSTTIKYYEVFTSPRALPGRSIVVPSYDEQGVMIGQCKDCGGKLKIEITNPDLSNFDFGYMKIDFFTLDNFEKEKGYSDTPQLIDFLEKKELLDDGAGKYDFEKHPLYICDNCESGLEVASLNKLKENWALISEPYWNYTNWALGKSRGPAPENIVIKYSITCNCGQPKTVFAQSKYHENTHFENHSFNIINIVGSKNLSEVIFGVYSKTNIMAWLYKLLSRWNFLYDRVYIISPFVGHQFLPKDKLVSSWLTLLGYLDPRKTEILVKSGQARSFKNAFTNINETSYEEMERFNLGSSLISDIKSKANFHAKIFCAVSQNRCEIMNGSSNLVEGPSFEVINFDTLKNYQTCYDNFLNPLGISDISGDFEKTNKNSYSLVFDENNGFSLSTAVLEPKNHIEFCIQNYP